MVLDNRNRIFRVYIVGNEEIDRRESLDWYALLSQLLRSVQMVYEMD